MKNTLITLIALVTLSFAQGYTYEKWFSEKRFISISQKTTGIISVGDSVNIKATSWDSNIYTGIIVECSTKPTRKLTHKVLVSKTRPAYVIVTNRLRTNNKITKRATTTYTKSPTYTKRSSSIRCSGTTQKGNRCKRMTKSSGGRCYQH